MQFKFSDLKTVLGVIFLHIVYNKLYFVSIKLTTLYYYDIMINVMNFKIIILIYYYYYF